MIVTIIQTNTNVHIIINPFFHQESNAIKSAKPKPEIAQSVSMMVITPIARTKLSRQRILLLSLYTFIYRMKFKGNAIIVYYYDVCQFVRIDHAREL